MTSGNYLSVELDAFVDDDIARTKGDRANVIVGIGYVGRIVTVLNPPDAAAALASYERIQGSPPQDHEWVRIIGFDDAFEAYDLSEADGPAPDDAPAPEPAPAPEGDAAVEALLAEIGYDHVVSDEPRGEDWFYTTGVASEALLVSNEAGWRISRAPAEDERQGSWIDVADNLSPADAIARLREMHAMGG